MDTNTGAVGGVAFGAMEALGGSGSLVSVGHGACELIGAGDALDLVVGASA